MQKLVSFSEWLEQRDPELYVEVFTDTKRKILGGLGLAGAGLAGLWGMGGSGTDNMPPPREPVPHVRSIEQDGPSQINDKMPPPPPRIEKARQQLKQRAWDAREQLKLLTALQDAGITVRGGLRTSGVPHGTTIDVNGDDTPDNPQENYFNTSDRTYYGKGGVAKWTWDGQNLHQIK